MVKASSIIIIFLAVLLMALYGDSISGTQEKVVDMRDLEVQVWR